MEENPDLGTIEYMEQQEVRRLQLLFGSFVVVFMMLLFFSFFLFFLIGIGDSGMGIIIENNSSKTLVLTEVMDDDSIKTTEIKPGEGGWSSRHGRKMIYLKAGDRNISTLKIKDHFGEYGEPYFITVPPEKEWE